MDKKVELTVINISNSQEQAPAYALILEDIEGQRQLPIIIGSPEAQAITIPLKNLVPPRPLTHDLFATCLLELGSSIREILIYKAVDGIFFSYIYLTRGIEIIKIDSRTSDAIALALRFHCPIYIYESILERECVRILEQDIEQYGEHEVPVKEDKELGIKTQSLSSLKKALAKAIEEENYELASVLRDEIARRK